jgi:LAS superfamily LD-carboxypeptidase LdcB
MANETEQLVVSLEARIKDFERNFQRASRTAGQNFDAIERRAKQSGDRLEASMSKASDGINAAMASMKGGLASLAAGLSVGVLTGIVSRTGEIAKGVASIGDEARRAGLSAKAFQELSFVADQNRISVDALTDGMKELSLRADEWITTGGGSAAEAFKRLGFSATDLKTKLADPSALLSEIIERVQTLDRAAQIRIFDEIFGGTGGEQFVRLIDRGADSIRKTVKEAHELGVVLDDDVIAKADEIDRKFNAIATSVSTKLKGAVVSVVTEMAEMSKALNGTKEQAVALAGNRLLAKYAQIDEVKARLDDLNFDLAQNPDDPTVAMNVQKYKELLAELKKEAMEIRDFMDRYQGYPGDAAEETKPKVDQMNNALSNTGVTATSSVKGINSYTEAIRALRREVPALAADLAKVDAQTRINETYRAALSKATSVSDALDANALRNQALQALDIKSAESDPNKFLAPYLDKSKTAQSLTGMQSQFSGNLAKMFAAAPDSVRNDTTIYSGYRSIERQQQLWAEALAKYGSPEAARKWVAPPGNSQHNMGNAADLRFNSDAARQWFHDNASQYGMSFPLGNEPWHIEDEQARSSARSEEISRKTQALTQQATAYQQIVSGAKQFTAEQGGEQQALTMSGQAAAAYRYEQQMLADAQRQGITLSAQQRQEIQQLAQGMAQAESATQQFTATQDQAKEVSGFFAKSSADAITGLVSGTMTAEQALQSLISTLIQAVMQAALLGEGPLAGFLGGGKPGSNTGGILGSFFGSIFGAKDGGFITPKGVQHFARGGNVRGPGTSRSDSVPAMLSNGEFVVNAASIRRHRAALEAINRGAAPALADGGAVGKSIRAGQNGGGSAGMTFAPTTHIEVNGAGGSREDQDRLAGDLARRVNDEMDAKLNEFMAKQMRSGSMLRRNL